MILATSAAAVGIFFAGFSYASASTVVTVKSGDTVWGLAQKYNVSSNAIENANNLTNANVISVGQRLTIPDGSSQVATTTTTTPKAQASYSYSQAQTTQPSYSYSNNNAAANTTSNYPANTASASIGGDSSAKAWIANRESGGSYSATNGQYVGKYQLSSSYLNGDYSAANQEKVANQYVQSRYGSWSAAKSFWQANGYY
ncbi:MAG: LysM peptidoglycan-binding domain-containing protein [Lentilactobacillus diolivorans]